MSHLSIFSPTGTAIRGTYESLSAHNGIVPQKLKGRRLVFEWDERGSQIFWDGAETGEIRGETVFEDENCELCVESELRKTPTEAARPRKPHVAMGLDLMGRGHNRNVDILLDLAEAAFVHQLSDEALAGLVREKLDSLKKHAAVIRS